MRVEEVISEITHFDIDMCRIVKMEGDIYILNHERTEVKLHNDWLKLTQDGKEVFNGHIDDEYCLWLMRFFSSVALNKLECVK